MSEIEYTTADGCEYKSYKEYVWLTLLDFCGCYSETLFESVFSILKELYECHLTNGEKTYFYKYKDKTIAETDLQELILHILDSKKWTEHGGSVRGSWLTDAGIDICKELFKE